MNGTIKVRVKEDKLEYGADYNKIIDSGILEQNETNIINAVENKKGKGTMATRKRKTKKKSVVDSAARNAASITDGCNPEFVKGATFDGIFEMPIIKKPKKNINLTNIYRSRAIGYCFQKNGVYVIPNVRWGDERTYTTKFLPEKVAFLGIEKHSIVSIGSYGQLKNKVNRYYFKEGFDAMMETLEPEVVLVYSKLPEEWKEDYPDTKFVEYQDWASRMRED